MALTKAQKLDISVRLNPTGKAGFKEWRQIFRQFPFAMKETLNDLAILFQRQQRDWQERVFDIVKHGYFKRAVKYANADRPSVNNLRSIIHIDAKGAGYIFERQELGGIRRPSGGAGSLPIPQKGVKRSGKGGILVREYPNRLKGKFVVRYPGGGRGLFQRLGRRQKAFTQGTTAATRSSSVQDDPNVIFKYHLTPKADIKRALDFFVNAQAVFVENFDKLMNQNLDEAFRKIKPASAR